jgi:WD40 repeat protein
MLAAFVICAFVVSAVDGRTWTTKDGQFSVEAELLDVQDGKASLRRSDGQVIKVALDRLSLADNLYVKEALAAAGPPQVEPAPIPAPAPAAPAMAPRLGPAESAPQPEPLVTAAPRRTATWPEPALTEAALGAWQVKKDPAGIAMSIPPGLSISIPVTRRGSKASVYFPESLVPFVAVAENAESGLDLFDLRNARRAGRIADIDDYDSAAVSPDGKHLATHSIAKARALKLWSFGSGKVVHTFALPKEYANLVALGFAGPDRLFGAQSSDGNLTVWQVPSGEVVTTIPIGRVSNAGEIATSPGGSYVAIANDKGAVTIYDTRNGNRAGSVSRGGQQYYRAQGLAFSPDGSELAVVFGGGMRIDLYCWGMEDGKLLVHHELNRVPHASSTDDAIIWFADKSAWLVNGKAVVDRATGVSVSIDDTASPAQISRYVDGDRMFVVDGDYESASLNLVPIPKDRWKAAAAAVASGGAAADVALPELTALDSAKPRRVMPMRNEWKYQPDGVDLPKTVDMSEPLVLGTWATVARVGKFSRPDAARVAIGAYDASVTGEKGLSMPNRFELYDLVARKPIARFDLPLNAAFHDLSSDGKRGAFVFAKANDRIDIYNLETGEHVMGFRPCAAGRAAKPSTLAWVAFGEKDLLFTRDKDNCLTAWDLGKGKSLYEIRPVAAVALSSSRRTLAVAIEGQIHLVEAATGEPMGALEIAPDAPTELVNCMQFNADGRRLASLNYAKDGIFVASWDLTSGKVKSQLSLPYTSLTLTWAGPHHVLLHNTDAGRQRARTALPSYRSPGMWPGRIVPDFDPAGVDRSALVDVERNMVVWTYQHAIAAPLTSSLGDQLWFLGAADYGRPGNLVALALPDPRAQDYLDGALQAPPVIGEGTRLSIDIDVTGTFPSKSDEREGRAEQIRKQLSDHFTALMKKKGVAIAPDAPATLRVSMKERSATAAIQLPSYRGPYRAPTIQLTTIVVTVKLDIVSDGKIVWSTSSDVALDNPGDIDMQKRPVDVTPEAFLRDEQWNAALTWIEELRPPVPLYSFSVTDGLGESLLLPDGPQVKRKPAAPSPKRDSDDKQT